MSIRTQQGCIFGIHRLDEVQPIPGRMGDSAAAGNRLVDLSWVPCGLILGLTRLTTAWTDEVLLGIAGLAIAGTEFD